MAALQENQQALRVSTAQLERRVELTPERNRQKHRLFDLECALTRAKDAVQVQVNSAEKAQAAFAVQHTDAPREAAPLKSMDTASAVAETSTASIPVQPHAALTDGSVLWAGGRVAAWPVCRCTAVPPDRQVNQRMLYAPRCEEQESQTRFDATLTAAESVICQTGCISLAAYLARREPLQTPWHPMRGRRKPGQRQLASG